ncbi:ABC-2 family transporter protein [Reinekea sp. G2M2-21]|uniref:ABC transporter permease n=1 Tax=Reinekea sp. G2M2-21 TaxID=2788942 RepID=UPI0018A9926A|nr:ABC-2 family transporter protein [Reinekea sp. G2M2-21]
MRALGFLKSSYHSVFAYRFDVFIGLFNNLVVFTIQYYLWKAVFKSSNGSFLGISEANYILYIGFGLLLGQITSNNIDRRIAKGVRTGNIIFDLMRPAKFELQMFFHTCGELLARSFGLVPILVVLFFVVDLESIDLLRLGLFIPSAIFAVVISFQVNLLWGLLSFKTRNAWGLHLLKVNLFPLLSGQIVAFTVLHSVYEGVGEGLISQFVGDLSVGLYWLSYCLPLQAIYFTPSGLLSGLLSWEQVYPHILLQLFWIAILYLTTRYSVHRLINSFEVQGG